ncbi:unnamed protein product [Prunus brigantina]
MEAYLRKRALVRNQDLKPGGGEDLVPKLCTFFELKYPYTWSQIMADNGSCRVAFVLCQTFKRVKSP